MCYLDCMHVYVFIDYIMLNKRYKKEGIDRVEIKKITIVADKSLNNGIPVAVDLLFIDEQAVLDSLSKMKALEWFSERKDYLRKYKSQLKIISYEVVPGQIIKNDDIPYSISGDAIAIIIFADYLSEGSFSSLIKNKSEARIRLGENDFETID